MTTASGQLKHCHKIKRIFAPPDTIDSSWATLSLKSLMAKDFIGYQALTDQALRGVVRDALRRIEKSGLIGAHHFYLTFKTHADGVDIPDFLKEQYPDEMTIIIQHQYWALKVKEDYFEVTLTFKKLPAPLHIPFNALTAFFDPGVQFRLPFRAEQDGVPKPAAGPLNGATGPAETREGEASERVGGKPALGGEKPGEVVSLDSF